MTEMRLKSLARTYRALRNAVYLIIIPNPISNHYHPQKEMKTSRQKLIDEGRIPPRGVPQLQEIVARAFNKMKMLSPVELATAASYYHGIGLSIAGIYAYAPQSRIQAIAHLKMSDLVSMFDRNLVLSDLAKTRQKYGPQPILFTADILNILSFFVDKVRIHLQKRYVELGDPSAPIFTSQRSPGKLANVARQLKGFFLKEAGI